MGSGPGNGRSQRDRTSAQQLRFYATRHPPPDVVREAVLVSDKVLDPVRKCRCM